MSVRMLDRENTEVLTGLGLVKLGKGGLVTNLSELGADAERKLLRLPGFEDTRIFPIEGLQDITTGEKGKSSTPPFAPTEQQKQALEVLRAAAKDPKNLNSGGKVDMGRLNTALRAAGLPNITGAERDQLATLL